MADRIEDGGPAEAGHDLVDRLTVKAAMISLGEKIEWASETDLMHEAAADITRLRAENAGMLAALKPFAKAGELFPGEPGASDYDACIYSPAKGADWSLCGDDLRRARAAISNATTPTPSHGLSTGGES